MATMLYCMSSLKKYAIWSVSFLAVCFFVLSIYQTIHSPLFTVQIVEVSDQLDTHESSGGVRTPVDAQTVIDLAAVPTGKVNLFSLDLKKIEARLLAHPWIKEVRLQKKFPQTLSLQVEYRSALAIAQQNNGLLSYVDSSGKFFDTVDLMIQDDLPLLSGFSDERNHKQKVMDALHLISVWGESGFDAKIQVSSIIWDTVRGFRVQTMTPMGRVMVDLGQEIDAKTKSQLEQLKEVFAYLEKNSIPVHQIWADAGKKIVVKTARGS